MSFREISIAVRAENRASSVFRSIGGDIVSLGHSFGLLDSSMGRAVSAFMSTIHLITSLKGVMAGVTALQTAHNTALGSEAIAHGSAMAASAGHQASLMAYTGVAGVATVATHGLRSALMGLAGPIGLVVGLATAMGAVAYATNAASDAQRRYQEEINKLRAVSIPISRSVERYYSRGGLEEP